MSSNSPQALPTFGPPTDDRSSQIHISGAITFVLAVATVVARIITRTVLTPAGLWLDDWLVIAAMFCQTCFMTCIFVMINFGLARHIDLANTEAITNFFKIYIPIAALCIMTYGVTKLSILAFYYRIFGTSKKIRLPIYITTAITMAWTIACVLVNIFQCRPMAFWWDKTIPNGVCINNGAFLLGNTIPNIITDWVLLVMPIPLIWGLKQTVRQKLALTGCFLLGGFVSAVTIVRFVMQLETDYTSPDLPWVITDFVIWTNVETNTAIMCACLPSLRPVFSFIRHGRVTRRTGLTPLRAAGAPSTGFRKPNKAWASIGTATSEPDDYPLVTTHIKAQPSQDIPKGNAIQVTSEYTVEHHA